MATNSEKTKSITQFIVDHIVYDHDSEELQRLIDALPEHTEEAAGVFCDWLELGNWFYEAMTLNDIDISEVLIDTAETRRQEEKEAADDQAEIDRDYRQAQGWPV